MARPGSYNEDGFAFSGLGFEEKFTIFCICGKSYTNTRAKVRELETDATTWRKQHGKGICR